MAPVSNTVDCLEDNFMDSDTWGGAEGFEGAQDGWDSIMGSAAGRPTDADNSTLEMESSFLMRTGRDPSNDEIMEYLEKHRLQVFLTDVIMHVARHIPPDPFDFLLNHIEAMVMKYRASNGKAAAADTKSGSNLASTVAQAPPPTVSPKERESIVQHIVAALQHEDVSGASGGKLFDKFASPGEKMSEEDCGKLFGHLQSVWGLQEQDTRLMTEKLKRWRFRANATNGTRGLPLWPIVRGDFVSAYPGMLRAVRDRYVPIGAQVHRSLFIRQATGQLADRYKMGAKLGQGAYGEVFLVSNKDTGERRVCKKVARVQGKVSREEMQSEVDLMRSLDHPHIIRLYEYFEQPDCLEMIMEPVFGGTMTKLVSGLYYNDDGVHIGKRPEALAETWVAKAFAQLLSALEYAHHVAGVIHKDLKCDNVLLASRPQLGPEETLKEPVHVMLADFGIAEVFSALPPPSAFEEGHEDPNLSLGSASGTKPLNISLFRRSTKVGGTPSYMSPEMFRGSFTEKSDMWSLGVMVYQVMTGVLPYQGANLLMQANVVCNPRRHPAWDMLSDYKWSLGARWFCQQLLNKDEGMRPSADEAARDLWLFKLSADHGDVAATAEERRALHEQHLQSHLMKMSMTCITSQLNLSQLQHMNLRFAKYDTASDGRLSHMEMRQVLEDVGIKNVEDAELVIESLDGDHSGMIEYSEFVAGCLDIASDGMKQQLKVVFGIFDLDGSGTISLDELRRVLTEGPNSEALVTRPTTPLPGTPKAAGSSISGTILPDGKTVEQVMAEIDKDGKGQVDFAEFEAYLLAEHQKAGEKLHGESSSN
mmetsp:Transcript_30960/g.79530  ORF Transcript_30960/g.79530 Transcript_30960/m.79530 type:complete len:817 (+) Transcript_30960:56-2506(+)